jgi:hypothetical protein
MGKNILIAFDELLAAKRTLELPIRRWKHDFRENPDDESG